VNKNTFSIFIILASLFVSVFASNPALALKSDREQPIRIQANSGIIDDNAGKSTYTGDVHIDQGSLSIVADEVQIFMAENEVVKIIAISNEPSAESSKRAHFEQMADDSKELVTADATLITYLVKEAKLHLKGKAQMQQTTDKFTGELLFYDINLGIVDLKSSGKPGDVINIIITPKNND
jgi:lipopolysaccharide export system protein LptA